MSLGLSIWYQLWGLTVTKGKVGGELCFPGGLSPVLYSNLYEFCILSSAELEGKSLLIPLSPYKLP